MDNGFRKFKGKIRIGVILRALLIGLSLGVILVAALWLIAKLTAQTPDFLTYGLMGGGLALVAAGILLAVTLPTDKRLAKRLDKKLELNEKVQTMVTFRNQEGDMLQLQRENTQQILSQASGKKLRSKMNWVAVICCVVAIGCMVGTVLVDAKVVDDKPPVDNSSWNFDNFTEQKLKDLIEYVRTSGMEQEPKEATVQQLESLQAKLKNTKKRVDMEEHVVSAITNIHKIVSDHNTHDIMGQALMNQPSEGLQKLGAAIGSFDEKAMTTQLSAIAGSLSGVEDVSEEVTFLANGINNALTASKVDGENALYQALQALAEKLGAVTAETTAEELTALAEEAGLTIKEALKAPKTNRDVEKYTVQRLIDIFGIALSKVPSDVLQDFDGDIGSSDSTGEENETEKDNFGGLGPGNLVFGSNDQIYDPSADAIVEYGTVIKIYEELIGQYRTDGTISEEMDEFLANYYTNLYQGPDKDDEAND